MFGNRSDNSNNVWNIGYDSNLEDIVGSSTWLRRMDRYEKEFDNLSNEEKKSIERYPFICKSNLLVELKDYKKNIVY